MPWVLAQAAHDVLAVHVPVDPGQLAARLPAGTTPDEHDGAAWATVLAMHMEGVHPRFAPSVPGVSAFSQVAVRAFVHCTATGEPGVAFLALDVPNRLVAVLGRRLLGLPYERRAVTATPGAVSSLRLTTRWTVLDTEDDDPFFAERDVLFSWCFGRLHRSLVAHPPVRFAHAEVGDGVGEALRSEGLTPTGPARPRATALLASHVGLPRPVRAAGT